MYETYLNFSSTVKNFTGVLRDTKVKMANSVATQQSDRRSKRASIQVFFTVSERLSQKKSKSLHKYVLCNDFSFEMQLSWKTIFIHDFCLQSLNTKHTYFENLFFDTFPVERIRFGINEFNTDHV